MPSDTPFAFLGVFLRDPALTPAYLLIAGLLAGGIAVLSGMSRLLSFSGALASFVVGFFIFGFGGPPFAFPLLAFFFSSSLLSRCGKARKARLNALYDKTATRDAGQVLANGGTAALLALASALLPNPREILLLYLAALAAVNADTWATEIGGLARSRPWLITTLQRVEPGTSGAVSFLGLLASLLGALFVVLVGWLAWTPQSTRLFWRIDLPEIMAVTWAGTLAAFADSILGGSVQAQYRCDRCRAITERREHCDAPTRLVRGWRWFTNDLVNLTASLLGVAFAWILLRYFTYPT